MGVKFFRKLLLLLGAVLLAFITHDFGVALTEWLILIMLANTPVVIIQASARTLVVGFFHGIFDPCGSDGCGAPDIILAVECLRCGY